MLRYAVQSNIHTHMYYYSLDSHRNQASKYFLKENGSIKDALILKRQEMLAV